MKTGNDRREVPRSTQNDHTMWTQNDSSWPWHRFGISLGSKQIKQNTIDKFILDRGREIKRSTLNKDIKNLRAFIRWCRKNRYLNGEIELNLLKEDERPVISLTHTQIQELLTASLPYPALRMRILLALGTGLRRVDIESWKVSELDFENSSVTTRSTKTRKSMGSRPVPVPNMAEFKKYVLNLPLDRTRYLNGVSIRADGIRCVERLGWKVSSFMIY
jgi:integrase